MTHPVHGRTILLAGGTSAAGRVVAAAAVEAGATVLVAGRDAAKLDALRRDLPPVGTFRCDLADEGDVARLAARVHDAHGPVDGVLHLVGGWRGGGGLAGQSDADFRALEVSLTALRHVSRVFDADLRAAPAGRLAIVSSTAVARPLAGGAAYAAVKAASEAWTRAVAHGFAKDARDRGVPPAAASVVFRVRALAGLEAALAAAFLGLWGQPADAVNDRIVELA
ncbi:SDR family NAD(P)-dependent oxidoreductase [Microbacterium sp. W1N]|uniref:SDR family NAD(P)-dependent oxidoreductase n=1 Tax=Microbacterium festucae TaxID=2977531 RepID=UPI0021C21040|nr:SDR family NAD(P)-dependent oxidoreductase [Microbacterium festucae]MCT9819129.1 SDR family NAD(P)-dependent oxidoreductase [Microbacterium festucae]